MESKQDRPEKDERKTLDAQNSEEAKLHTEAELKRAREEANQQREWFRVTLSSIGDAVITTDMQGRVTFINPVAERMTGWKLEEAAGRMLETVFVIVNEYTLKPTPNPITRVLAEGIVVGLANHTALIAKDGTVVSIEDSAAPIRDSSGQVMGAVMVFHDVSERRRQEEVLRWSEERFRAMFNQAAMGMAIADLGGKLELVNEKFAQILGYSQGDLTGKTVLELTHPDDLMVSRANIRRLLAGETTEYSYEKRFVRKDGGAVWTRTTVTILKDGSGKPEKFIGVVEDISARKAAEQELQLSETRLNLAMEAGQMGAWEWVVARGKVTWSATLEAIHGMKEGTFGGTFEDFQRDMHPEDRELVLNSVRRCLEGTGDHRVEYRIIKPDGKMAWIEARGKLFRDAGGNPERMVGICMDITARKRSENALRESEQFNRTIIESSRDCIKTLDLDGKLIWISDSGRRVLCLDEMALVGMSWVDLWEGDYREKAQKALNNALAGESGAFVGRFMVAGEIKWFDVLATPIMGADGKPERVLVVSRDVTERTLAEEARFRLAALVESSEDAIVSKTLEGVISTWNKSAERMFGYEAAEVIGKPVSILIPKERLEEEPAILEKIKHGIKVESYETVRRCKDGRLLDVSLTVSPIKDAGGVIIGASKILRDITQRKRDQKALLESEQRFRIAADTAPFMLGFAGPDRMFRYVNKFWTDFVGQRVEEQLAMGWCQNVHPDDMETCLKCYHAAFDSRKPFETEYRVGHQTGGYRWISVRGVARYGPAGQFEGYIIGCTDIHDRKMASQEREQLLEAERSARAEAERLNVMKDEFLATLSHELRTPLSAILGWSQLLMTGKLGPEGAMQGLETINRNARAQSQLIEDLLDMSRIVSGKVRVETQKIGLEGVVQAAVSAAQPSAQAKGVDLKTELDADAGMVWGDAERLQQVMWNLVSNAVKFTPRGGSIQVKLRRVGSDVELTVSDTGMGISAGFLPYVFDRFRQGDSSSTRKHGGLGLGLSIVKHMVELHGGMIRASSDGEGKGATFTVRLPMYNGEEGEGNESEGEQREIGLVRAVAGVSLEGVKVLVVDDELDARELARRMLMESKAEVISAASSEEGLKLVKQMMPHVIVSDIGMPGEDGYQFIKKVRGLEDKKLAAIPAVALTAFARGEDYTRAIEAGYEMHLRKPIKLHELVSAVAKLSGRLKSGG